MRWRFGKRSGHLRLEELSEYLDGRLSEAEAGRVEAHLASCAACRDEVESLRQTVQLLRRLPQLEPQRPFVFAVPPVSAAAPRRRVPAWAYGAVASAFALAFAVVLSVDMVGVLAPSAPLDQGALLQTAAVDEATVAPSTPESFGAELTMSEAMSAPKEAEPLQGAQPPVSTVSEATPWVWHLAEGLLAALAVAAGGAFILRRRLPALHR